MFRCLVCSTSGNRASFITQLHERIAGAPTQSQYVPEYSIGTSDEDLIGLVERRPGLTLEALKAFGAAFWKGEYWLPSFSFNAEGKIIPINLYPWRSIRDAAPVPKAAPNTSHGLVGLNLWDPNLSTVYLCEGHWDPIALYPLVQAGLLPKGNVLGYAGASFPIPTSDPTRFLKLLAGKNIVILPDNDEAGRNGLKSFTTALAEHDFAHQLLSLKSIVWPAGTPNGFDIRDVVRTYNVQRPKDIYSIEEITKAKAKLVTRFEKKEIGQDEYQRLSISLQKHLERTEAWRTQNTPAHGFISANLKRQVIVHKASAIQPIEVSSFSELTDILGSELHTDETWDQILALLIAITLSPRIAGPMLWSFLIGDAGTGKTLLLDLLSASQTHVNTISRFNGLYSGIGKGEGLLGEIRGRCLGIKDFTTLMSNPATLGKILDELRDLFDGTADVHFLNGKHISVRDMRFSMIACTTPAIHKYSDADKGSRFLFIDMSTKIVDGKFHYRRVDKFRLVRSGIDNLVESLSTGVASSANDRCKSAVWGYLEYLTAKLDDPSTIANVIQSLIELDPSFPDWLAALGQWVGAARSIADTGEAKIRQEAEAGTRLGKQFFYLAALLFIVYDEPSLTPEIIDRIKTILKKVAYDTGFGWQQDLMLFLAAKPDSLRATVRTAMGIGSDTTMQRIVTAATLLGIINEQQQAKTAHGRPPYCLSLTEEYYRYAEILGFTTDPDLQSMASEQSNDSPGQTESKSNANAWTQHRANSLPSTPATANRPAESSGVSRQLPSFARSLARRPSSDPIPK